MSAGGLASTSLVPSRGTKLGKPITGNFAKGRMQNSTTAKLWACRSAGASRLMGVPGRDNVRTRASVTKYRPGPQNFHRLPTHCFRLRQPLLICLRLVQNGAFSE